MTQVKCPQIEINLDITGEQGNAFFILGYCQQAMRTSFTYATLCDEFMAEAKSADYKHLLATVQAWFKTSSALDEQIAELSA